MPSPKLGRKDALVQRQLRRDVKRLAAAETPVPVEMRRWCDDYGVSYEAPAAAASPADLSDLSKTELGVLADEAGIEYTTRTTKAQLVELLEG